MSDCNRGDIVSEVVWLGRKRLKSPSAWIFRIGVMITHHPNKFSWCARAYNHGSVCWRHYVGFIYDCWRHWLSNILSDLVWYGTHHILINCFIIVQQSTPLFQSARYPDLIPQIEYLSLDLNRLYWPWPENSNEGTNAAQNTSQNSTGVFTFLMFIWITLESVTFYI